jgi:hypothetical protein
LYLKYCKEALAPKDIKRWCFKKTVTKSVLSPDRPQEQKVLDACNDSITKGIINRIQEGDKVYLYQALDGEKPKLAKGEPVLYADGRPKMVQNTILKFPELYQNDHDQWHYVDRVYSTLEILDGVINIESATKFSLKSNREKLNVST